MSDGISAPVSAIAYVSLDPVNDAPIIVSEVLEGAFEDKRFEFNADDLLAGDWDVEQKSPDETDNIHFTGVLGAAHGTVSYDQASGTYSYMPDANFNSREILETIYYQIQDDGGLITTGESYIYVTPLNDAPLVEWDYGAPAEEEIPNHYALHTPKNKGLLDNDHDIDGDRLYISGTPTVLSGNAKVSLAGNDLIVKPNEGAGRVIVEYMVSDGNSNTPSRLIINDTPEHNTPPEFFGANIRSANNFSDFFDVLFSFNFMDKNITSIDMDFVTGGGYGYNGFYGLDADVGLLSFTEGGLATQLFSISYYNPRDSTDTRSSVGIPFTVTARDSGGCTTTVFAEFNDTLSGSGHSNFSLSLRNVSTPVVLDLNGNGVELLAPEAGTLFDWNGDGLGETTGWVGAGDGILAYDFDDDGRVTLAREISFKDYLPGATTDLQGLAHFDSNGDGLLDASDDEWAAFGVCWRDGNSNGASDDGEFRDLTTLGIASLSLASDENTCMDTGNTIFGLGEYTTVDGQTHVLADVGLTGEKITLIDNNDDSFAPWETVADAGEDGGTAVGENADDSLLASAADQATAHDETDGTLPSEDSAAPAQSDSDNAPGEPPAESLAEPPTEPLVKSPEELLAAMSSLNAIAIQLASDMATAPPSASGNASIIAQDDIAADAHDVFTDDPNQHGFIG